MFQDKSFSNFQNGVDGCLKDIFQYQRFLMSNWVISSVRIKFQLLYKKEL